MRLNISQVLLLAALAALGPRDVSARSIQVARSPISEQNVEPYYGDKFGIPSSSSAVGPVKGRYHRVLSRAGRRGRTKEEGEPSTGPASKPNTGIGGTSKDGDEDEDTGTFEIDHSDDSVIISTGDKVRTIDPEQPLGMPRPDDKYKDIFKLTMAHFKENDSPKLDQSVFYSGKNPNEGHGSYYDEAIKYAEQNKKMCFDSYFKTFDPMEAAGKEPFAMGTEELKVQQQIESGAFARASRGVVFVYLPDTGVPVRNTWTEFEWPELVRNPLVTKIVKVNPDTKLQQDIWVFGDGDAEFPITPVP